ncbi:HEPN domain-containing protein [Vulcanisaeta thermophila]
MAIRCAKLLSEHYIGARYPNARLLDYAEECIKCMELVFQHVL